MQKMIFLFILPLFLGLIAFAYGQSQPYDFVISIDGNYIISTFWNGTVLYNSTSAYITFNQTISDPNCNSFFINPGTYTFNQSLSINKTVDVFGASMYTTILYFNNHTDGLKFYNHSMSLSNVKLKGIDTNGTGLLLSNCWHSTVSHVWIEAFEIGCDIYKTTFSYFYDLNVRNNQIGLRIREPYGGNAFYGGTATSNYKYGISIEGSTCMNQFYGMEIEINKQAEVRFFSYNGKIPYANKFYGCYFERSQGHGDSATFILWYRNDSTSYSYNNLFESCKFALQLDAQIIVKGDENTFAYNVFDGANTCTITLEGTKNLLIGNRRTTNTNFVFNPGVGNVVIYNDFSSSASGSSMLPTNSYQELIMLMVSFALFSVCVGLIRRRM